MSSVRVRIAPSPTGYFHIGTARTALFNWVFARKHKGSFIVRIEDTDKERSKEEFERDILENLEWLGLAHDEFYRQSGRGEIYKKYLGAMLADGNAFFCAHTKEELDAESKKQRMQKEAPRHICSHRNLHKTTGVVRFKNNAEGKIVVRDIIRGDIEFDPALLGDFSVARNAGEPLYNFAVAIDDADMKISHVIRGEDHLPNTPKQILLMRALNLDEPSWAHLPLLLGKDKSKLSKRHGAVSLKEYRDAGYTADALKNFIMLLGWHPSDGMGEVLNESEILDSFLLERVQKAGAIVDAAKLDWLNKEYIAKMPDEKFFAEASAYVRETKLNGKALRDAINAAKSRVTVLSDVAGFVKEIEEFSEDYSADLLLWKGKLERESTIKNLDTIVKLFSGISTSNFSQNEVKAVLEPYTKKEGNGPILWPLRASLSGREASFGPYELAGILGKEETEKRLRIAIDKLCK